MPPIEFTTGPVRAPRAIGPVAARSEQGPVANATARAHASAQSAVVRGAALDPGTAPVDAERVATIRKAIEQGTYPVIPTRVADAMIAAGLLLRNGK